MDRGDLSEAKYEDPEDERKELGGVAEEVRGDFDDMPPDVSHLVSRDRASESALVRASTYESAS
jgi:hypothetical protein